MITPSFLLCKLKTWGSSFTLLSLTLHIQSIKQISDSFKIELESFLPSKLALWSPSSITCIMVIAPGEPQVIVIRPRSQLLVDCSSKPCCSFPITASWNKSYKVSVLINNSSLQTVPQKAAEVPRKKDEPLEAKTESKYQSATYPLNVNGQAMTPLCAQYF